MTKAELIEALEDLSDDAEVTLALQPNYPMSGSIRNICIKYHEGEAVGAIIACSDNEDYGMTREVWHTDCVEVDEDGEILDEE